MGKWRPCGSPGKMDQAGPLTPISKYYIFTREFFLAAIVKLVTREYAG